MNRREVLLACAVAAFPSGALSQPAVRKIGFVSWFTPQLAAHAEQFRKGLREFGCIEGRDATIEAHFTSGDPDRTREIVRKYVRLGRVRLRGR
jgi:hypothetical protein